MPTDPSDPRITAFCSPVLPDLFHAVAHHQQIWRRDPYDVETIHAEARGIFERLLQRVTAAPPPPAGRLLLLLGESGSGKTHLLRACRNSVHAQRLGYCGYLQMTTATSNFARYVLGKLLESLEQPYLDSEGDLSGLMRLANGVVETPHSIMPAEVARLREAAFGPQELAAYVQELADLVVQEDRFSGFDIDLVRAMLYLQRNDAPIRNRVMRYLRCEDLAERDRQMLGGLVPRKSEEDPLYVLAQLGRMMALVQSAALVICFDQFDDLYNLDNAQLQFRRALTTISALADQVPSSVFVIACLEDLYVQWKGSLTRSLLDRLENDPEPVRLVSARSAAEVEQLVGRRMQCLYETAEVPLRAEEPTYPIPLAELRQLSNLRTRDVLDWCRVFREQCIAGHRSPRVEVPQPQTTAPPPSSALPQAWEDAIAAAPAPPEGEAELAALLAWAVKECSKEVTTGHWFEAEAHSRSVQIEVHSSDGGMQKLLVGICNKKPQGGALAKEIQDVVEQAGDNLTIVVRSGEFPAKPKSRIADLLGQIVQNGGRRVSVPDSDWRAMRAFQDFHKQRETDPQFQHWLREDRPLSRLKTLRDVLDLDHLPASPAPVVGQASSLPSGRQAGSLPHEPLFLGTSAGLQPTPVTLLPQELIRHAAFLGGSGSGKTTLALNVIEQLLLRGIPALLLDRKGDLCGYARPDAPVGRVGNPSFEQFRSRIDVALYTPGNPDGRPLSIPLVPAGLEDLPSAEREILAHYAAAALGGMMGYKDQKATDGARQAILSQAINLIAEIVPSAELTLDQLLRFLDGPDPSLLAAIGRLETKHCRQLVQDLETLRLNKKNLLSAEGEHLRVEELLGLGEQATPGRTRLCIISTKFLGDNASVEFWVAQLLLEVARYANRHPSPDLQAVLLFDEADLYLPATRRPATKEPMENLLKRARSAGLGVLLASQSPGDFDYKCRDNVRAWLLGRITQPPSLAKLKPVLSDCRIDVAAKLPGQQPGQFFLVRESEAVGFLGQRSLLATEQLADDAILELARANRCT